MDINEKFCMINKQINLFLLITGKFFGKSKTA